MLETDESLLTDTPCVTDTKDMFIESRIERESQRIETYDTIASDMFDMPNRHFVDRMYYACFQYVYFNVDI